MTAPSDPEPPLPAARCPICRRPAAAANRPFCSKRCADVDLHRWLSGVYAIPVKEEDDDSNNDNNEDVPRIAPGDERG